MLLRRRVLVLMIVAVPSALLFGACERGDPGKGVGAGAQALSPPDTSPTASNELDCFEELRAIDRDLDRAAVAGNLRNECVTADDCEVIRPDLSCHHSCPYVVGKVSMAAFRANVGAVDLRFCSKERQCAMMPLCAITKAACVNGRCRASWPELESGGGAPAAPGSDSTELPTNPDAGG